MLSGISGTNPVILFAPCFVLADDAGTALALFLWSVERWPAVADSRVVQPGLLRSMAPVGTGSAGLPAVADCPPLHWIGHLPRFLILPWIQIPNLGSHILAIVRRQLPID